MTPYYSDDNVALYLGDCLELVDVWAGTGDADVLVTDPPYGIGWRKQLNRAAGSRAHDGIANDGDTTCRDHALGLWGARPAVVFGSLYAPAPPDVRHVLIWEKPADAGVIGSTLGFRRDIEAIYLTGDWPGRPPRSGSIIRSSAPNVGGPFSPAGVTSHPHAKPVDLMRKLIDACPPGLIVDPFAGSGSTLRAAKDLGRRAIGIEIEERYCEIAARRLAQEVLAL